MAGGEPQIATLQQWEWGYMTVSEGDAAGSSQRHLQIGSDNRSAFCPQSFADIFSHTCASDILDHSNLAIGLCKDNCYSTGSKCQQFVL